MFPVLFYYEFQFETTEYESRAKTLSLSLEQFFNCNHSPSTVFLLCVTQLRNTARTVEDQIASAVRLASCIYDAVLKGSNITFRDVLGRHIWYYREP